MTDPSLALQIAVVATLRADTVLNGLLGGAHVYDTAPGNRKPPWIVFDENIARADDVAGAERHEHRVVLHCVSDAPGIGECAALAERVHALLHAAALTLDGHHLVYLTVVETALRRSAKKTHRIAALRLRALTETLT